MTKTPRPVLTTTRHGAVCEINLARPELHNRVDAELHVQLTATLRRIADDRSIGSVILTSQGTTFSAGGDFELMRVAHDDPGERRTIIEDGVRLLQALHGIAQPVVAAVQGPAIGLGATIALSCDAVVAGPSASFADSHVAVGLAAGDGGCLVWPATAGMIRARRHLLTGDPIDRDTAYALGMVTDLVDTTEGVGPAALALATRIAALPPLAVQNTKRALNVVTRLRASEIVDIAFALESETLASDDLLEGIAALRESRTGRFIGR
ncbi:enoyl-CoA hydratase/isomerase family protein [Mycobacterium sherrisii]|uniref:enoyl-CoA hydratase/isomerase family protein n=1 Tax=Mycobacterium sherrisii TaxID=243061 RepID=UPI000A162003|nr:enoyl-CoA hydratase/isomerase family protein [Mycobacterium sherrisii]MCV7032522.1 enoyl-CoA hydratase/isomerase family protein [Mycobacterium sherrisii]ORW74182.1 enoyl-CoA hydratase [Mycobacterium sherrisii]